MRLGSLTGIVEWNGNRGGRFWSGALEVTIDWILVEEGTFLQDSVLVNGGPARTVGEARHLRPVLSTWS
jgi:hypothetical protein